MVGRHILAINIRKPPGCSFGTLEAAGATKLSFSDFVSTLCRLCKHCLNIPSDCGVKTVEKCLPRRCPDIGDTSGGLLLFALAGPLPQAVSYRSLLRPVTRPGDHYC